MTPKKPLEIVVGTTFDDLGSHGPMRVPQALAEVSEYAVMTAHFVDDPLDPVDLASVAVFGLWLPTLPDSSSSSPDFSTQPQ